MDRDSLIDALLARIDEGATPAQLMSDAIADSHPELHRAATSMFGAWPIVLAEMAIAARVLPPPGATKTESSALVDEPRPERVVGSGAERTLMIFTTDGNILTLPLNELPPTREPRLLPFPDGPDSSFYPVGLELAGFDTGVALFTTEGQALILEDRRMLDPWKKGTFPRKLHNRFPELAENEGFVQVLPTPGLRSQDRFYSITREGQFKGTDCKDFGRLSKIPSTAFLVRPGDAAFRCYTGAKKVSFFVGSSYGKAIVFSADKVRSQGRKAGGVRSISLDAGAHVVGAFPVPKGARLVALATDEGMMKRTPLTEYRAQGRGGGGLQSTRLSGEDLVATMTAVDLSADIMLITSHGRYARFPAYELPFGPRHARGERILDLSYDEQIRQLLRVPAGEFRN